ncbi:hypothetical protein P12x_003068 [Tundrisphaera lichenicola]|uniref:hypothetical protein n=1 Tax=Tundrisphaera lichenicola TaxID=2029860 RepID=UPI003EBAA45A
MRLKLGQRSGPMHRTIPAPVEPTGPVARIDLEPRFSAIDPAGEAVAITLRFDAYDPAAQVKPSEVHAFVLPDGMDDPGEAQAWLDSAYPRASTAVPDIPAGEDLDLTLAVPGVPEGMATIQLILAYDE